MPIMQKEVENINKYEREVMFNVWFILGYIILISAVNLILPVYRSTRGYKSVFQWILIIVYFYGYAYQSGLLLGQKIPMIQIVICRICEIMFHTMIFKSQRINWTIFAALLVLDVIYVVLLMFDKLNYEYKKEDV